MLFYQLTVINNNNNNPICKAPECQKTSVALKDFHGALVIHLLSVGITSTPAMLTMVCAGEVVSSLAVSIICLVFVPISNCDVIITVDCLKCPFSIFALTSLIFCSFSFSLSFIGFTYFLLLSIPSLSARIVPLRFQAGGRRKRPNLVLVCCV